MGFEPALNAIVAVGVTDVVVSEEKPLGRKMYFIQNSSTGGQTITISYGIAAVANQGVPLAQGQFLYESINERYNPYGGTIHAISSLAGGQLSVVEL